MSTKLNLGLALNYWIHAIASKLKLRPSRTRPSPSLPFSYPRKILNHINEILIPKLSCLPLHHGRSHVRAGAAVPLSPREFFEEPNVSALGIIYSLAPHDNWLLLCTTIAMLC